MKKIIFVLFCAVIVLKLTASPVYALTVFEDHFDDGVLSGWSVSFDSATGWTNSESGTNLNVTNINGTAGDGLKKVLLSKTFSPLNDFNVDFDFSWDSENSLLSSQRLLISLYDQYDAPIAIAGYKDQWTNSNGKMTAYINTASALSGYLGNSDTAYIDVSRTNGNTVVLWNGNYMLSGNVSNPLSKIIVEFSYYARSTVFFGNESLDLVRVSTPQVPEPSTLLLLSSVFTGMVGFSIKKKI